MKRIIKASLVASLALSGVQASSLSTQLNTLEAELADLKKQVKKQNKKINEVKAHDSGDNIKWGVDLRTAIDNINYDMADGTSRGNDSLMGLRLLLNMAYAPDQNNVFKGQLSMNKAFGADFGDFDSNRAFSMGSLFDWTGNTALGDNHLRVAQAYWLYLGDKAFGADMPWTFSLGRRPSGDGFLANLREDNAANSPLGHVINVEFDGLSSKLDLSNVTSIPGMSIKLCMGRGSTNATPLFADATPYAENDGLDSIDLAGFIFEPYNDGQYIVKATWYRAYNLPGMEPEGFNFTTFDPVTGAPLTAGIGQSDFKQYGDMDGAAISVLVDGLTDEGYFADVKLFGSFAWTKTRPDAGASMLGSNESETGTSYWFGAYLPVTDGENNYGTVGLEYNHGSQYWRPFTYAEDTMVGSKIAARGDAWEASYTYQISDALSLQARYTDISYDYAGSQGFFGNLSGDATEISKIKEGASMFASLGGVTTADGVVLSSLETVGNNLFASGMNPADIEGAVQELAGASLFAQNVVEAAQDFRLYLRYRF